MSMQVQLEARKCELIASIRSQREGLSVEERNADPLDQVAAESNREDAGRSIQRSRDMLKEVDGALGRIKAGEYGDCLDCGQPISQKRLLARPMALRCIACQELYEHTPVN
jgi:DnaK suppressor protein